MNSSADRRPSARLRTVIGGAIPVVLTGALLSIDHIPGTDITLTVPYAAEGPGPTVDTLSEVDGTQVVDVKAPTTFDTGGHLNMTTVSVRSNMTLAQALGRWLFTDDTIVPLETVIPQDMTDEEVSEANEQAFIQSESAATMAAMEYLKKPVKIEVAQVLDDAPAAGIVKPGDVITHVDGAPVDSPGAVQERIRAKQPGDSITLSLQRKGDKPDAKDKSERLDKQVMLAEHPHDKRVPLLGVSMMSAPKEAIDVTYNLQDIGGPSAGMMFSLAVIDKLSAGQLNGGKFVAGTGTIAEDGHVGEIGGIVHKVEAAEAAGAELFLAPAGNCAEATSRDHGDMVVAQVSNLDEAVAAMEGYAQGKEITTCD